MGALWLIATLMSIILSLSPIPTMQEIFKNKSTLSFSVLPYAATAAQSSMWLVYSSFSQESGQGLVLVNAWGVAIQLVYCVIFAIYATDRFDILKTLIGSLAIVILLWAFSAVSSRPDIVSQYSAMILNICMFASPLAVVKRVIETRSVAFMPLPLSVASLGCALAWFIYGFSINLPGVIVPNGLGVLLGLAQILIFAKYYTKDSSTPTVVNDGSDNTLIGNDDKRQVVAI